MSDEEKELLERLDASLNPTVLCDVEGCKAAAEMQMIFFCKDPRVFFCGAHGSVVRLSIETHAARGDQWMCPQHGPMPLSYGIHFESLESIL